MSLIVLLHIFYEKEQFQLELHLNWNQHVVVTSLWEIIRDGKFLIFSLV